MSQARSRAKAQAGGAPVADSPLRVAIYARLSHDRLGEKAGVANQIRDSRDLARLHARAAGRAHRVRVFEDRDLSAFQPHVVRPGFEDLCQAVRAGELDLVIVWRLDRLVRRLREAVEFLDLLTKHGAHLRTVSGGIDTSETWGTVIFKLFALLGEIESSGQSERVTRSHRTRIEAGRAHPGGQRPFGLDSTRTKEEPREAEAIREAARRILEDHDSIRAICRDWNAAGLLTSTGKRWQPQVLSRMLASPRLAGYRMHRGAPVSKGDLPAILSEEVHQGLVAVLGAPTRRTTRETTRSYVLSGVLTCSGCGKWLVGRPDPRGNRRYVCDKTPGRDGCGKRAIQADPLEDLVLAALERVAAEPIARAEREAAAAAVDPHLAQLRASLAAVTRKREDTRAIFDGPDNDDYAVMDRVEFTATMRELGARRTELEDEIAAIRAARTTSGPDSDLSIRAQWAGRDAQWRREVVKLLVGEIRIGPGVRGRNTFDPERVEFASWRA